jgi:DNA polymerase-3 subunit beta
VRTQTLNVRSGASNTDLKCIDSQEFPIIPVVDLSKGLQINVTDLKEMIQQVVFSASDDLARPVLTGVYINVKGNKITMAAADGFRLSVRKAELSTPSDHPITAVIPARAMSELARIASDGDQTVTMVMPPGRGQVVFRLRDIELVSQLIEGVFPDFEQIIPRRCDTRAVISTSTFLKAVKQAEIFAREGSYIVRINLTPGGELKPGLVEISGQSDETGFNQNQVDANIEGPQLLIAFNVRFLREALDVIRTPNVALETTSETSPGMIRQVGGQTSDGDYIHVIMPMHLGS